MTNPACEQTARGVYLLWTTGKWKPRIADGLPGFVAGALGK
jgi:hypothetical protein